MHTPQRAPGAPAPGSALDTQNPHCFGCGTSSSAGLHLALRAGPDVSATGEFTVTDAHQGAPGLAHGGLLACALDESMAALFWLLAVPAVTGTLTTQYHQPVPVGSRLLLRSWATGLEGRKIYTEAEGRLADDPEGTVVVRASATFVRVDLEHFRAYAPDGGARYEESPVVGP